MNIIDKIDKTIDSVLNFNVEDSILTSEKLCFIKNTLLNMKKSYLKESRFSKEDLINFNIIYRWSIDEWDWEENLTKCIWDIDEIINAEGYQI